MRVISKKEFERLNPLQRGYATYMFGAHADQPNVPNEKNPYPPKSRAAERWEEGQQRAAIAAQDSEE